MVSVFYVTDKTWYKCITLLPVTHTKQEILEFTAENICCTAFVLGLVKHQAPAVDGVKVEMFCSS